MNKKIRSIALHECAAAKAWRVSRSLSIEKLAEMTGFSEEALYMFERGRLPNGKPVTTNAWIRYRHICASIDMMLRTGGIFKWGDTWLAGS